MTMTPVSLIRRSPLQCSFASISENWIATTLCLTLVRSILLDPDYIWIFCIITSHSVRSFLLSLFEFYAQVCEYGWDSSGKPFDSTKFILSGKRVVNFHAICQLWLQCLQLQDLHISVCQIIYTCWSLSILYYCLWQSSIRLKSPVSCDF